MAKFIPTLALIVCLASLGAAHAQETTKPIGKWERKIGKSHATLIVEDNRLHLTVSGAKPCTVHADYSMTRDGIVYGVVTSAECDDPDEEDDSKSILDAPFSCRFRIDEGALIVRDLKCLEAGSKDETWNGRFKAVPPTPIRTSAAASSGTLSTSSGAVFSGGYSMYPPSPVNSNYPPSTTAPNNDAFNFWLGFSR